MKESNNPEGKNYLTSWQMDGDAKQYLIFLLGGQEYAIDIMNIREIRRWSGATTIPNMPGYVLGVINVNGVVVPIIDLRLRFHLPDAEFNASTVVIITKVSDEEKTRNIGLVVDAVSEVYKLREEVIGATQDLGGVISENYIKGLATMEDRMIILLDAELLINIGVLRDIVDQGAVTEHNS